MKHIFIGYDSNETVAYHVLAHSLMRHSTEPLAITALKLSQLPMARPRDPKQSTEFSFSRFLVPYLSNYEGYSIFMDCDFLCRYDITTMRYPKDAAVSVVKHNYKPKTQDKFLGNKQTLYAKKNWSSLMVFNNAKCRFLTPHYVNHATGLDLHQFKWVEEKDIGALDPAWNHLVDEYPENPNAKMVHFTRGGPWFAKFRDCEFSREWRAELALTDYRNTRNEYSLPDKAAA